MTVNLKPSIDRFKQIRAERECSVFEANSAVVMEMLLQAVDDAESVDDLKSIMRWMLKEGVIRT